MVLCASGLRLLAGLQLCDALGSQLAVPCKGLLAPLGIHCSSSLARREMRGVRLVVQSGTQPDLLHPRLELTPAL